MERGKDGAWSCQWSQDKMQQAPSEIYEIPPKHNENLFVVQADGQGSRRGCELSKLGEIKHCLDASSSSWSSFVEGWIRHLQKHLERSPASRLL